MSIYTTKIIKVDTLLKNINEITGKQYNSFTTLVKHYDNFNVEHLYISDKEVDLIEYKEDLGYHYDKSADIIWLGFIDDDTCYYKNERYIFTSAIEGYNMDNIIRENAIEVEYQDLD